MGANLPSVTRVPRAPSWGCPATRRAPGGPELFSISARSRSIAAAAVGASLLAPGVVRTADAAPTPTDTIRPLTTALKVTVATGSDGVAQGSNLNVVVDVPDQAQPVTLSMNSGAAWPANTTKTVTVSLPRTILRTELKQISLGWAPAGSDGVDVTSATVVATGPGTSLADRFEGASATIVNVSGSVGSWVHLQSAGSTVLPYTGLTPAPRPNSVLLTETAQRSQGQRRTCISFTAIAATEAAYRRAGYGSFNLSEEFTNWMSKANFLDPFNTDSRMADGSENQLGTEDGGSVINSILNLIDQNARAGTRIPVETTMPYRSMRYTEADDPLLSQSFDSATFDVQRNTDTINLSPKLFPDSARAADTYYGITSAVTLKDHTSLAEIESILASHHEVAIDLGAVPNGGRLDGHAVLLYGYTVTNSGRAFYVKDSGGFWNMGTPVLESTIAGDKITGAAFVSGVREPGAWTELGFVGRWTIDLDGWRGTLDITHVPHTATNQLGYDENRIGTFFDSNGKAFRVNGEMSGSTISFFVDKPELAYSAQPTSTARRFTYRLMRTATGQFVMSGTHTDGTSITPYGGYAIKDVTSVAGGAQMVSPLSMASYAGARFDTTWNGQRGTLTLSTSYTQTATEEIVPATLVLSTGSTVNVTAVIDRADPRKITLSANGWSSATAYKTTWDRGILAGQGLVLVKQ